MVLLQVTPYPPQPPFPLYWHNLTTTNLITYTHTVLKFRTSTIQVYVSGINFFSKLLSGAPAEPQLALKPVTTDLLTRRIQTFRSGHPSPSIDSTLKSKFHLAFLRFIRCLEFTSITSNHDPSRHATLSVIGIHLQDTLQFNLKQSKTDQFRLSHPIFSFRSKSYLSPY